MIVSRTRATRALLKCAQELTHQELPKEWIKAIRMWYMSGIGLADHVMLTEIPEARSRNQYSAYLTPPTKYTKAYRLMTDVSPENMAKLISGHSVEESGVVKGGTFTPRSKKNLSSWTVDESMLYSDEVNVFRQQPESPGNYTIVMTANLSAQRDRFIFNPDVLPRYVFKKATEYEKQMEIVAIGPVELISLAYKRRA